MQKGNDGKKEKAYSRVVIIMGGTGISGMYLTCMSIAFLNMSFSLSLRVRC